jgi:hypothetical protein
LLIREYLSKDLKPRVPKIMEQLKAMRPNRLRRFTSRIIDDTKVTDHHAIIPNDVRPLNLSVKRSGRPLARLLKLRHNKSFFWHKKLLSHFVDAVSI